MRLPLCMARGRRGRRIALAWPGLAVSALLLCPPCMLAPRPRRRHTPESLLPSPASLLKGEHPVDPLPLFRSPPLLCSALLCSAAGPFCSPHLLLATLTMATVDTGEGNEALQTVAPRAPVTFERPVSTHGLGISKPNVPRALVAVDADHPNGTPGYNNHGYSVLQQHVAFFDRNHDGIIYPWETFAGFRAIGFNLLISFLAMVIISGAFSYATLESWIPSPLFPIYIKNIHKAKHGSDSEVYDTEGRFVPQKFEELFTKFAKSDKNKLHFDELYALTSANKNAVDPFGWTAEKLEWGITYLLLKDQGGYVSKEQVRGMYDGSLFETIAKQREQSTIQKKKM